MDTHSQIQELANHWEIENLRNKSHAKISKFTVFQYNITGYNVQILGVNNNNYLYLKSRHITCGGCIREYYMYMYKV